MCIEDVQAVGMVFHVLDTLVVCEDSEDCDLSFSLCFVSSVRILSFWTGCSRVESELATGSEEREEGREGVLRSAFSSMFSKDCESSRSSSSLSSHSTAFR